MLATTATGIGVAAGLILDKLDALASHGGRFDKGSYMTEEVVRVPLAVRYPALIAPDQQLQQLASGVDIPVTILAAAGTAFSHAVDGRSLLPLCTDEDSPWREDLLVETYGHGFGTREICRLLVWDTSSILITRITSANCMTSMPTLMNCII